MSLTRALFATVVNDASVQARIGYRFRPGVAYPKDELPFADYIVVADTNEKHSAGRTKAKFATVEVVVYAADHSDAETISELIKAALEATTGLVEGVSGLAIRRIDEVDRSDQPDLGQRGQSKGPFAVSKMFNIKYLSNT